MATDLTHDRRHRERHEIRTRVDVEPDHGIDQAHPSDLHQVVARFAATVESAGDVIGQRQASLDDAVPLPLNFAESSGTSAKLAEHVGDIRVFRVRP